MCCVLSFKQSEQPLLIKPKELSLFEDAKDCENFFISRVVVWHHNQIINQTIYTSF